MQSLFARKLFPICVKFQEMELDMMHCVQIKKTPASTIDRNLVKLYPISIMFGTPIASGGQ